MGRTHIRGPKTPLITTHQPASNYTWFWALLKNETYVVKEPEIFWGRKVLIIGTGYQGLGFQERLRAFEFFFYLEVVGFRVCLGVSGFRA